MTNSNELTTTESPEALNLLSQLGLPITIPTGQSVISWADAPLEDLLGFNEKSDKRPDEMTDEELAAFVQRAALLRSSHQTAKAAIRRESVKHGGKAPKDNGSLALALLDTLMKSKTT